MIRSRTLQEAQIYRWREHLFGLPPRRWAALDGKVFWVTGAGSGFGRSIVIGLAAAGAHVFLTGRRPQRLQDTIRQLNKLDIRADRCHIVTADLSDLEDIQRACEEVKKCSAALHGLVNNAGVPSTPGVLAPLQNDSVESWNRIMGVNVTAPWLLTRTIFEHLRRSGHPRVIFITSGAGWSGAAGYGIYNVSKTALNSLCHSMACEYQQSFPTLDVQINAVDPGQARTDMNTASEDPPSTIISIVLLLLSHPPGGPNGRFFHRDGRHLSFGLTGPYERALNDGSWQD